MLHGVIMNTMDAHICKLMMKKKKKPRQLPYISYIYDMISDVFFFYLHNLQKSNERSQYTGFY